MSEIGKFFICKLLNSGNVFPCTFNHKTSRIALLKILLELFDTIASQEHSLSRTSLWRGTEREKVEVGAISLSNWALMSGFLAEKGTDGCPRQDTVEIQLSFVRGCLMLLLSTGPERRMRSRLCLQKFQERRLQQRTCLQIF